MLLTLTVRDLLLLTWEVMPGAIARKLPDGVTPALTEDGAAWISLVGVRNTRGRLGAGPVPPWSQITVRTYVDVAGEPAIFFLSLRVTVAGLGAGLFGVPVRPASARVVEGLVRSRGLGVHARYRRLPTPPAIPQLVTGPLGSHDVAYLDSAGLRRLASTHAPFAFETAELVEPLRIDPLLALGFDLGEPLSVLYAARTEFSLELPPTRV